MIGAKAPVRYGPKPPAAGPLPSGWDATASGAPTVGVSPGTGLTPEPSPLIGVDVPVERTTTPFGLVLALLGVGGAVVALVLVRARSRAR